MPYQTPSASQYTQIKRLQTDITGKANQGPYKFKAPPLTYGGYYAGIRLAGLPPNALLSNKFIEPEVTPEPQPPVVELDFSGDSYYPAPIIISPVSSTIIMRLINVSTPAGTNSIIISNPVYDFNGSTLTMTSPKLSVLSVSNPTPGIVNFVMSSDLSSYSTFEITLSVGNGPLNQINSLSME